MGFLKEQFLDWKYLISADNTTSRGFYIFLTIAMALLFVGTFAFCVVSIIGMTTGVMRIVGIISPIIAVAVLILLMVMLSRN